MWRRDLQYALRQFRRSLAFHLAIVLMLALGIGANTSIFSVLRAVLLRALPYRDAARLVAVTQSGDKVTGAALTEWQARSRSMEGLAYYWDAQYTLTGAGTPRSLNAFQFSANLFPMLGAQPLLGRTFVEGEERVAVLSYTLWQSAFGGDHSVLGRSIQLDGQAYTVVGVMPEDFAHPNATAAIWTPLKMDAGLAANRELHAFMVLGRLARGSTIQRARAEMGAWGARIQPLRDVYAGNLGPALWALQGAVLFLLLIACANVANMLLARAGQAEREVAIRLALGAGRGQLFRQFATHGILLSLAGAAAGVLLAGWGVMALPRLFAAQFAGIALPSADREWIDWSVLSFTLAIGVAAGLVFGAIPALRTPGIRDRRVTAHVRGALIVAQVALSLVLMTGSGLLIRSVIRLEGRSLGLRTDQVVTGVVVLPPNRYRGLEQTSAFLNDALGRLATSPEVEAAGAISTLPLSGMNARRRLEMPGQRPETVEFRVATPGYFRAMGIQLQAGRLFDERDRRGSTDVAIVNQRLARRLWPGQNAIGKMLPVADLGAIVPREVVGVVGDVRHSGLASEPPIEVYRPAAQVRWPFFAIVARGRVGAATLEQAVWAVDKDLPVQSVRTMETLAAESIGLQRASMWLLAIFAAVALVLSSLGIYSVMSYVVAQRTQEIGIRIALGARPVDIVRTVVGWSAVLAGAGLVGGVGASWGVTRYLSSLLFGISPTDTVTLTAAAGGMALVAALAALRPARRAAQVDPVVALRWE